jgi:hypothetical protein
LFLKFLVLLPSLKELDLSLKLEEKEDFNSFKYPLAQVRSLQKLTLRLRRGCGPHDHFRWFGRLIANSPNLAYLHLQWHENEGASFLEVFDHVPVDRPAQLKHFLLDTFILYNEPKMFPHLRSLQSLHICWPASPYFWQTLALNGIFIPFLTVGCVNWALCDYLLVNASLVSFTIATSVYFSRGTRSSGSHLFGALETTDVAQITISPFNWAMWHENAEVEAGLRRCAKLRRITLNFFENGCRPVYEDIVSVPVVHTFRASLSIF